MRAGRREEARQGRDAPADGCGTAGDALLQRVEASGGLARAVMGLGTALIVSPDGRRPEGARDVTSIASGREALGRPHPCAVRPTRG
jgi:hypothetical protein